eukprot:691742_1
MAMAANEEDGEDVLNTPDTFLSLGPFESMEPIANPLPMTDTIHITIPETTAFKEAVPVTPPAPQTTDAPTAEPNPFLHVDVLPMIPSRMYYNPELCLPSIVDNEGNGYNICPVWHDRGFLSDVDPIYDINKWSTPQAQGVNVTVIPYKDTDIAWNELSDDEHKIDNTFLLNHKNRILEFIHNERKRQHIIKQFDGQSFKVKSLKLIRSRKEIKPLIKDMQHNLRTKLRLIAIFIEFKWNHDEYFLSIKPRRKNRPHEKTVMLCLFVFNGAVAGMCEGLMLKSCLVMKRNDWIRGMYDKPPYHQIETHILYLNQFWLHCLSVDIAPYWSAHYCGDAPLELSSLMLPTRHIPYFYQKRFRMYARDDSDEYSFWYHRKHFCRRFDLDPPKVIIDSEEEEEEEEEEPEDLSQACRIFDDNINMENTEFVDVGIECYDGIFSGKQIVHIMRQIDEYLNTTEQPHFALEYRLQDIEKEVINETYPDVVLSNYAKYQHEPETYSMYKGKEWWPSDEEEEEGKDDYDTDEEIEKKFRYFGYYNFTYDEKRKVVHNDNGDQSNDEGRKNEQQHACEESKIDQIYHANGAIPIPAHFQSNVNAIIEDTTDDTQMEEEESGATEPEMPLRMPRLRNKDESREGTKEYHEEVLKRYIFKYNKVKKKIRDRETIKKAMSDLNAAILRSYMHNNYGKAKAINITNALPSFWTEEIKPQLLKYKLEKLAKCYQFAFVYTCEANRNNLSIPMQAFTCDDGEILHFQNSELALMVFCENAVTLYLDDISLIALPGRMYTFNYNTIGCDHMKVFNHTNAKIDLVMLRHTPCHVIAEENADDYKYLYFAINSYNDNAELIQVASDGEFHSVTEDDDGLPILGDIYQEDGDDPQPTQMNNSENEAIAGVVSLGAAELEIEFDPAYSQAAGDHSEDLDHPDDVNEEGQVDGVLINPKWILSKYREKNVAMMRGEYAAPDYKSLLYQKVLRLDAEEKSYESALQLNTKKELINAAFDKYHSLEEQRKYFRRLLKTNSLPEYNDDLMFYIANSYEMQGNYEKALEYLDASLVQNEKQNRKYYKALTVRHKYDCLHHSGGIEGIDDAVLGMMEETWKNTVANEDNYRAIRDEWRRGGEETEELMGAAGCAVVLATHFEDQCVSKWNDVSLVWYKRALNILERAKMIMIQAVPTTEVVALHKDKISVILTGDHDNERKSTGETVPRKRVHFMNRNVDFLKTLEHVLQNYMQCLIERFLARQYTKNNIENEACFVDFKALKNECYDADFDVFLQYELDSIFEMNHYHFEHVEVSRQNNSEYMIADVYLNYAVYVQEVFASPYYASALALYEHSLKHNQDAIAYWNMAEIYEQMTRYDDAVHCLGLVIQNTPNEADDYHKTVFDVHMSKRRIQQMQQKDAAMILID